MKTIVAIGVFSALATFAQAASIAVSNASFEDPNLAEGGWANALGGDWIESDGSTGAGGSFIEHIPGFSADGNQHVGIASAWGIGVDTGAVFAADTRYSLLIAAGNRNASFTVAGNVTQYGLVDGLGGIHGSSSYDASAVAEGGFADAPAFVFDVAAGSALIGQPVIIGLASAGPGRAHFDNIRLDASPISIPEPVTGLLAGLAGLMLLRRKR